ncbi:hypothetical protein JYT16_01765 [Gemmatimonas aurantiaca]|nr:hypothetical protein [Gemmatimonas aurantiaca]
MTFCNTHPAPSMELEFFAMPRSLGENSVSSANGATMTGMGIPSFTWETRIL